MEIDHNMVKRTQDDLAEFDRIERHRTLSEDNLAVRGLLNKQLVKLLNPDHVQPDNWIVCNPIQTAPSNMIDSRKATQ